MDTNTTTLRSKSLRSKGIAASLAIAGVTLFVVAAPSEASVCGLTSTQLPQTADAASAWTSGC